VAHWGTEDHPWAAAAAPLGGRGRAAAAPCHQEGRVDPEGALLLLLLLGAGGVAAAWRSQ
jgi:hypothetical protein